MPRLTGHRPLAQLPPPGLPGPVRETHNPSLSMSPTTEVATIPSSLQAVAVPRPAECEAQVSSFPPEPEVRLVLRPSIHDILPRSHWHTPPSVRNCSLSCSITARSAGNGAWTAWTRRKSASRGSLSLASATGTQERERERERERTEFQI